MWTWKSCSTVATAAPAPPYEYAKSALPTPPTDSGIHRSRGIESIVTCLVEGTTLTRIIDWVNTRSPMNFESSSEPSSSTVNAPVTGTAVAEGEVEGTGERSVLGDGVTWSTCPVDSIAS